MPTLQRPQRFEHLTLEEVVPIRFEMIEHVLEVIDIPRIRERKSTAAMKIHSACRVTG